MKNLFYSLICTMLLCVTFSSCETTTTNSEKCWYVTIDAEFIVKDHPNESWSCTIEAYVWLPESKVEKEVSLMVQEIKKDFEDYDEVNITNTKWEETKIETEQSCEEENEYVEGGPWF